MDALEVDEWDADGVDGTIEGSYGDALMMMSEWIGKVSVIVAGDAESSSVLLKIY